MLRPALAIARTLKIPIDHPFVRSLRFVPEVRFNLLDRWWQPREIERDSPDQLQFRGFRRGLDALPFQVREHEEVDSRLHPTRSVHARRNDFANRLKGPKRALLWCDGRNLCRRSNGIDLRRPRRAV